MSSRAELVVDRTAAPALPVAPPPSEPLPEVEVFAMPAVEGQIRFWSLDQLNPGNPALNMPLMWQCRGPMNVERLTEAFTQAIARHEMLRTTFDLVDGRLSQIIHPPSPAFLPVEDLQHLPDAVHSEEAQRLTRAHAALRMDLRHGPLLQIKLLRFAPQAHLLLVTMHHIICDGISLGILLRDIAALYEALAANRPAELPELPIQFADYAVWHEEWRASEAAEASAAFWRKSLGNDFSRIQLPRDRPEDLAVADQKADDITGDIETRLIPPGLTAAAHAFCMRENVTFNILLTSVFCALLNRLTGQRDLTLGSPCANRNEDTEDLVGLFMNIQILRVKLEEAASFRSLLAQVQDWTLGAYENQLLPFEDLVHDPFFAQGDSSFEIPVFFLYQKSFMVTHRVAGLEIVPLRSESPGAVFELMFAIVDRAEEGPRLQLEYNPQAFRTDTIQHFLRMYIQLLESAISSPETRVDRLTLLPPEERAELLAQAAATAIDFGPFVSVQASILARAQAEPERVALVCEGRTWSFGDLARYSSALAGRLVEEGLTPGALVGVSVERSPAMVGAVLAVLLAGGAYVPLDPRHPTERLAMILEDSQVSLVLVDAASTLDLPAGIRRMEIDPEPPAAIPQGSTTGEATLLPATETSADDLAYVIYTSGSTGKPKGVAIPHGALRNLLLSMQREPGITPADTLVSITTLAFDIAALELFLPLLSGAKLVLATYEQAHDGTQLRTLLEQNRATMLQATPGAWRMLLDAGWQGVRLAGAPVLKVLCGGEALPRDLADRLLECSPDVWNVYGPTETTIWSSATRVTPGTGPLVLGPPIANTQFYVLDGREQLAPAGVEGELYIGGAGLAQGYWNRPDLTAEKFIPNPFGPGRIYRTGDLARRRPDGHIELLGRSDFQVKVRGYRIELGEIESALASFPGISEAVVVRHVAGNQETSPDAATRLVAFVATGLPVDQADPALADKLYAHVLHRLPDYMVPNAILPLESIPRTPNRKVDRSALQAMLAQPAESGIRIDEVQAFVPPADILERQLVQIWQTVLGLPRISTQASFFSLGVGSLAALRLIHKMNDVFKMDLGLASLISNSTIASTAELIRTRFAPNTTSTLVPIHPEGSRPPLFIVHGVGGNVINFYGLSTRLGAQQPVYGIQAQSLLPHQPALLGLEDMATYYLRELRTRQPQGPYYLLGYSFGGTMVAEMARQLRAAGQTVALLGMLDAKTREYEEEAQKAMPVQTQFDRRVERLKRNTDELGGSQRLAYLSQKAVTRAIRFSCMAAAACRIPSVPSFMKSAYDINYVALRNYTLKPLEDRLVLFRATEQDFANAPYHLGWESVSNQPIEVHELPGDHDGIFLEPNIELLATRLREVLSAAQKAAGD